MTRRARPPGAARGVAGGREVAQDAPGGVGRGREGKSPAEAVAGLVGDPGASRWTITIWDWTPPSVNRLLSSHWAKAARLKADARDRIYLAAREAGVPEATGKRRVSIAVWVTHGGHLPDGDNVWKALLDGCVRCRLLIDDSATFCELGPVLVERRDVKATIIHVEDI